MRRRYAGALFCFSPPVMLATFALETAMAIYTLWRYKLTVVGRIIVAMLIFLGLFQLSEYFVCGGWGLNAEGWSRTGYAAITILPPLGLHLLCVLAKKPERTLVYAAYATVFGFIGYFLSYHAAFQGYQCTGNYVIFQLNKQPSILYGIYYYGWLLAVLTLGFRWVKQATATVTQKHTIRALIVGYLVFLVPTAIANTVDPATRRGIPSIMCGFAVLFACILTFYILPHAGLKRRKKRDES